jgi:hypothetical protein
MAWKLNQFLQELPQKTGLISDANRGIILSVHKIPIIYRMYINAFKAWNRIIYGKSIKINPFTGELMDVKERAKRPSEKWSPV